jgi:hypothetical protein
VSNPIAKNPEDIPLDELFVPVEGMSPGEKTMLSRALRGAKRIAYKPPFSGPQREIETVADLLKFRAEVGGKDLVKFIDQKTGEVFEPLQLGDRVFAVMRDRLRRRGFELEVVHINATKKRSYT